MEIAPIRVGVRAVILQDDQILLVKFDDENGPHYNYPGGGMRAGESIHAALQREVREETSAEVDIVRLLAVYEYLAPDIDECTEEVQKICLVFLCTLKPGSQPHYPALPDLNQTGVEWIALNSLQDHLIYPPIAKRLLECLAHTDTPDTYLGNCYHFPLFS